MHYNFVTIVCRSTKSAASMSAPKFSSSLSDKTVNERESVTFECKVEAIPTATIQWLCNSVEIKVI